MAHLMLAMSERVRPNPNPDATLYAAASPLLIALVAGALAVAAPACAVLALAALAARVLMRGTPQFDPLSFAGPALAIAIVGELVGLAGAIGMLFAWRLFSDVRWSMREAARLELAAGRPAHTHWRALCHAWLTPAYGLTLVAYTAPHMVAGLPLDLPHVPFFVPVTVGVIATVALFDWLLRRAADWRLSELAPAPTAHLLAHHIVFVLAFGTMFDVSAGIVALAAWRLANAARRDLPQLSLTAVP
jgi:hypothetical protein